MKPLLLLFSLFVLFVGCTDETLVGPRNDGSDLVPAKDCSINTQLC